MMHLNSGAESMLHCCALLAALPAGKALPAAKLAEYHDLPAAFLAKQLQSLAAAGLVTAGRGRFGGGYRLARPPERITLLDIIEAVEGRGPLFRCTGIRFKGPCAAADRTCYPAMCAVNAAMSVADRAWRDALAGQTLADLVADIVEGSVPEVMSNSMAWLQRAMR